MITWLAPMLLVAACNRGASPEATARAARAKSDADAGAKRFVTSISEKDKAAVRGMLGASVRLGSLDLVSDSCRAQFGEEQKVVGAELDVFAACLVELDRDSAKLGGSQVTRDDGIWFVDLETECAVYNLELTELKTGGYAVVALAERSKCGGEPPP